MLSQFNGQPDGPALIDLHAHVLPGLDDGPATLAAALDLLHLLAAEGVATVVASPHADPDHYPVTRQQVEEGVAAMQAAAAAAGLALAILPGMELTLTPDLVARLRRGEALGIAGGPYVCVELPHGEVPHYADRGLFELMAAGYRPVLNHPERNRGIQRRPERWERLAALGAQAMVTAGSLTGRFGSAARSLAQRIISAAPDTLIVSDAHDVTQRPPELR